MFSENAKLANEAKVMTVDKSDFAKLECEPKDNGQRIEVSIVVAADKVTPVISEFYCLLARVKGLSFSDAADARQKLEAAIGIPDLDEACRDFVVNKFTTAAVRALAIDTVLTPGVHVEEFPREGSDFSFVANLTPRPELSLSSTDPVHVSESTVEVEERDIDAQVAFTANQFASLQRIDRAVLQEGDFALMDVDMICNRKVCKDLSGMKRVVEVRRGLLPGALIDALVGMKAGEMRKVSFDLVPTDPDKAPGDLDHYVADVRLWEIQEKVLPEVTDEWIVENLPQFESVAGFREYIRSDLEGQKARVEQQERVRKVRSALEKRLMGSIPDEMYEQSKESLLESTMRKLEASGKTLDAYCEEHGIGKDAFNMNVFMQASEYLRQNLALDVLAKEKGFRETDEDVQRAKAALPLAVASLSDEQFAERGFRKSLGEQIRREKAMAWLMETAVSE